MLRIVRSGIHATLQDAGRVGYRSLGVPVSGALDAAALHLLNALLDNPANTAAVETLYSGMTLELTAGTARIALAGATGQIERGGVAPIRIPAWHSVLLRAGDRLRIAAPSDTAAAYLAVEGGYAIPTVLGSASTYVQGALGGHEGRALRAGDVLALVQSDALPRAERRYAVPPDLAQPSVLRAMSGPQADRFADNALDRLISAPYRVTSASNRSGLRLEGPKLDHTAGHDLLSEGVATGSIQVPGSGLPVILVADHPTVGGYPKIATVISADWAAAGRLRIGSAFRFELVDEPAAASARRAQRDSIANYIATIEPVA
ncbi:MAG: biotin-dependent carboxyltransferase family protein [Rhodospirillaceae bacterium]